MTHDYNPDQSIDLNLTQHELGTLSIALLDCLSEYRIEYKGGELVCEGESADFSPNSHIGVLINTFNRVQMARLGNKNWNNRDVHHYHARPVSIPERMSDEYKRRKGIK